MGVDTKQVLAVILGGDAGTRLFPLTESAPVRPPGSASPQR